MILVFPAAGNFAGNSFGIGADSAFWKQLTQSFQWLAVNSLPLRGREFSRGGQGTFLARAAIFFGRAGNSPSVTGVTKSSRVSRGNIP
jgi:hypothetical protein